MEQQTITIAGRMFKGNVNSTMEADVFNQALIARAGLDSLKMNIGETAEEFVLRVYRTTAVNSDVFLLLGGMLIPATRTPESWTPEMAEQTALFLKHCTDPMDKKLIQAQITAAITGFITAGLISIGLSQRYSKPISEPISPYEWSAEDSPSDIGQTSSENLQATT